MDYEVRVRNIVGIWEVVSIPITLESAINMVKTSWASKIAGGDVEIREVGQVYTLVVVLQEGK